MDKLIMENMAFYGYHGVLQEEKTIGQKFFIDAHLYLSLKKAGETDDLNFSVNYEEVYDTIRKVATNEKYNLLEGLAERICSEIFLFYPAVQKMRIRVKKPEAPVPGIFDYFGVEIERERQE
ncbi:MAG: dihydroneopterin aldolase [Eubacteriales bacterium]|nr:dihydroneopterin aldolase [Eubacteriales bacterium]